MKLNLPALLMIVIGTLLIYGAYKNQDPRNVVFEALGIKQRVPNPVSSNVGTDLGPGQFVPHIAGSSAPVNTPGVTVTNI